MPSTAWVSLLNTGEPLFPWKPVHSGTSVAVKDFASSLCGLQRKAQRMACQINPRPDSDLFSRCAFGHRGWRVARRWSCKEHNRKICVAQQDLGSLLYTITKINHGAFQYYPIFHQHQLQKSTTPLQQHKHPPHGFFHLHTSCLK